MKTLEQRLARLEQTRAEQRSAAGTPEQCCASFGYTLDQACAEFGSFPAFCYAMMIRRSADETPVEGDVSEHACR